MDGHPSCCGTCRTGTWPPLTRAHGACPSRLPSPAPDRPRPAVLSWPPVAYNWCIVPESSYDVVLFGGLAVVLACMLQGKLASLVVLIAGAPQWERRGVVRALATFGAEAGRASEGGCM